MKKFITSLLLLTVAACLMPAWAQSISIGGTQISLSTGNVTNVSAITSGTVHYNSSSRTLTLTNATITTSSKDGIYVTGFGENMVTIRCKGNNTITTSASGTNYAPIFGASNLWIESVDGELATLNLNNNGAGHAVYMNSGFRLDISGLKFNATSTNSDCLYASSSDNILAPNYTFMELKAPTGKAAIKGFTGIYNYRNNVPQTVVSKLGHRISNNTVVDASGNTVASTSFAPSLTINGRPVIVGNNQSFNTSNGAVYGLTNGTMTWDYSTKTLTLNSVQINGGIDSYLTDWTINLVGSNLINPSSDICFDLYGRLTISGSGLLSADASTSSCVYLNNGWNASLTLNVNNYVYLTGKNAAVYNAYNSACPNNDLILKKAGSKSYYWLQGKDATGNRGSIQGICHLTMENMDFYTASSDGTPGAYFNPTSRRVERNGGTMIYNEAVKFNAVSMNYGVYVCGQELNDCNSYNFGSPYMSTGILSYHLGNESGTGIYGGLTLDGVTINYTSSDMPAILSKDQNLIVEVKNANNITAVNSGINLWGKTEFRGTGSMNVTSKSGAALSITGNYKTTIGVNGTMDFCGATYGYWGHNNSTNTDCDLILKTAGSKSDYYFNGNRASIQDASHLTLTNMDFFYSNTYGTPGCYFDEAKHCVVQNGGGTVAGKDVNFYSITETYPVQVFGKTLNNANCRGVGSPYIKSGPTSISYDKSENKLTLNNADVENTSSEYTIKAFSDITIDLIGDNALNSSTAWSAIQARNDAEITVTGSGSLTTTSTGYGIYLWQGGGLHVKGNAIVDVRGTGTQRGVGDNNTVTTQRVTVSENGVLKAARIEKINSLTLNDDRAIVEPVGAVFNNSTKCVRLNDMVAENVVIAGYTVTTYDLRIAGTQVTNENASDILGNGIFSYDDDTKTLTINGNYNNNKDDYVINSSIWGLTINVASNSLLTSTQRYSIIQLEGNTTITGGPLSMLSTYPNKNVTGICLGAGTLTIKDANVNVLGDGFIYGITGKEIYHLVIDNSDVTAYAHREGAIVGWGSITLNNCYVDTPRPAQILSNGIADGEGYYVGAKDYPEAVVIKAGTDAVRSIEAADAATNEVYDVAGRRLDNVSRGINIIRTSDGKVRKMIKK